MTEATTLSCLTPPGRAALATLALSGPHAWPAVRALFRPRKGELPATPEPGAFWLGRMGEELADDVVVAVKRVEPTAWVEVHAHGGPEVVRLLTELFASRGLRPGPWPELLGHAGEDPLRGAAALALAHAPTTRTAAILLDQLNGAFASALAEISAALSRGEVGAAVAPLAGLARRARLGRRLTAPWRVVVAGAPNVGKSSLVNALAGYQRAIVAPTPGTTRDVVTTALAIDGWPVELADTAGLRELADPLEEEGIRRARERARQADLCLWLLDAATEAVWPSFRGDNILLVVNKVDLPPAWDLAQAPGAVRVSAATGAGLAELCSALSRRLVPEPPAAGLAVPFTEALAGGVEEALRQVEAGQAAEAEQTLARLRRG